MTNTFMNLVQDEIFRTEALMRSQAEGQNSDLAAALALLLSAGGKRIRPAITFLIGRIFNANSDRLVTLAAAIELLHTATLVHDDLIDGALLRRGTPTLNSQWSPGATVLTGDFIFARAARLAAATKSVEIMEIFAQTLTVIVNGEISQLFSNRCKIDRQLYQQRIYAKTASLFETSAQTAAIISQTSSEMVTTMQKFGYSLGMAFQIVDDILDFTGEQATIGKPVGSDLRQGIITLPVICFSELYPSHPALGNLLKGRCLDEDEVSRLIDSIRASQAIFTAFDEAKTYIKQGLTCLAELNATPEKRGLQDLANYIIDRQI